MSSTRQKVLEKVRKLIALSASDNANEAREAALAAARLIREHGLLDENHQRRSIEELFDEAISTFLGFAFEDTKRVISVGVLVDAVAMSSGGVWHKHRRRLYHRVRYKLQSWVDEGLLSKHQSGGYLLVPGTKLKAFGFQKVV